MNLLHFLSYSVTDFKFLLVYFYFYRNFYIIETFVKSFFALFVNKLRILFLKIAVFWDFFLKLPKF